MWTSGVGEQGVELRSHGLGAAHAVRTGLPVFPGTRWHYDRPGLGSSPWCGAHRLDARACLWDLPERHHHRLRAPRPPPVGLVASSFTSVSTQPPLVSVCTADSSTIWPRLRTANRIGISVLATEHRDIVRQLSAKDTDDSQANDHAIWLNSSPLRLSCTLHREIHAGDHIVVLLEVESTVIRPEHSRSTKDSSPRPTHANAPS
ncbi:flavin reductase family protein [Spirillospora sp. NPDC048911]|uniref:flavin reductase family protein n=1 Tax=Spirillospora sp. NPDC048911 TaxID=3364527 RepID=UPI00371C752A